MRGYDNMTKKQLIIIFVISLLIIVIVFIMSKKKNINEDRAYLFEQNSSVRYYSI